MCMVNKCHAIRLQSCIHMLCAAQVPAGLEWGWRAAVFVAHNFPACFWGKYRKRLFLLPLIFPIWQISAQSIWFFNVSAAENGSGCCPLCGLLYHLNLLWLKISFPPPSYFLIQSEDRGCYCRKLRCQEVGFRPERWANRDHSVFSGFARLSVEQAISHLPQILPKSCGGGSWGCSVCWGASASSRWLKSDMFRLLWKMTALAAQVNQWVTKLLLLNLGIVNFPPYRKKNETKPKSDFPSHPA